MANGFRREPGRVGKRLYRLPTRNLAQSVGKQKDACPPYDKSGFAGRVLQTRPVGRRNPASSLDEVCGIEVLAANYPAC
ncbi:hypothetical protein [Methyloglobulus sp.]|uniref:hypothetical protein n=1 Tax=Methyloglobulus sp. TaxID=2518622 RepID=UPI00398949A0